MATQVDRTRARITNIIDEQLALLGDKSKQKVPLSEIELQALKLLSETYTLILVKTSLGKRRQPPGARTSDDALMKYASE